MQSITFICTVHNENGKCNAEELYKIISAIAPEVIFVEALESTYSEYQQMLFSSFGIYHNKLEIQAIQKYSNDKFFKYVPVLDFGLSDAFDSKYIEIGDNVEFGKLIDNFNKLAAVKGFPFLNSVEGTNLQEEMRVLEENLLKGSEKQLVFQSEIRKYEDSMLKKIQSYCKEHLFDSAVFLCGVAHRSSMVDKIASHKVYENEKLNWLFF